MQHLPFGLGLVMGGIAYSSRTRLRATRVPGRVKRIAGATLGLTVLMVVLGLLLWFRVGDGWILFGFSVYNLILLFRVVNALAIITQAEAIAIPYDMWEDREFEK